MLLLVRQYYNFYIWLLPQRQFPSILEPRFESLPQPDDETRADYFRGDCSDWTESCYLKHVATEDELAENRATDFGGKPREKRGVDDTQPDLDPRC
jgi:hypothetical protein